MGSRSKKRKEPEPVNDGTLEERLRTIFANELGVDEESITLTATVRGDLNGDSLDDVGLICAIEDEFDMSIPDEVDAEELHTFGDWLKMVEKLQK